MTREQRDKLDADVLARLRHAERRGWTADASTVCWDGMGSGVPTISGYRGGTYVGTGWVLCSLRRLQRRGLVVGEKVGGRWHWRAT